jgi:endonuclease G
MIKKLFFLLLLFRVSLLFPCDLPDHFDFKVLNNDDVLYIGCYDAIHKGPHIIEYILTKERAEATGVSRPSASFTQNRDEGVLQKMLLENGFSLPHHSDYTGTGYDRGHMAPNADFNDTYENALATFFMGNIWPQTPYTNRITWLRTERQTRDLASEYLKVKVLIIVDEFNDLQINKVYVPVNFKRNVFNVETDELIYEIVIYNLVSADAVTADEEGDYE